MPGGARAALTDCFEAGLDAVRGDAAVTRAIASSAEGPVVGGYRVPTGAGVRVAAVGKAAAPMAAAAVEALGGRVDGGVVVTRDGYEAGAPSGLSLHLAAHPVPDARSAAAGRALIDLAGSLPEEDVLLVLLSGGASALASAPMEGLEPPDLQAVTEALLRCGADIHETNCVRKHLSALGGGGLAAARGEGPLVVLAVSDVRGDRLDVIGSGPCEPDPTTFADALGVVARYQIGSELPEGVLAFLEAGARGERPETWKGQGGPAVHTQLVARNADARRAAALRARALGFEAIDAGEGLVGEARGMGARLGALGAVARPTRPTLLVCGGETVVTLRGDGLGGRSQELALGAALMLDRLSVGHVTLLAAGTDGADGPTRVAGGIVDDTSVPTATSLGLDPGLLLANNDSHRFLDAIAGHVVTGPTRTNVMDLVLVALDPDAL